MGSRFNSRTDKGKNVLHIMSVYIFYFYSISMLWCSSKQHVPYCFSRTPNLRPLTSSPLLFTRAFKLLIFTLFQNAVSSFPFIIRFVFIKCCRFKSENLSVINSFNSFYSFHFSASQNYCCISVHRPSFISGKLVHNVTLQESLPDPLLHKK